MYVYPFFSFLKSNPHQAFFFQHIIAKTIAVKIRKLTEEITKAQRRGRNPERLALSGLKKNLMSMVIQMLAITTSVVILITTRREFGAILLMWTKGGKNATSRRATLVSSLLKSTIAFYLLDKDTAKDTTDLRV